MMTSMVDVAVIGCGIVGAATAYELSRYDLSVTVLEAANDVADGTTKANSAILHAGYDPHPGTRMAALNVEGARLAKELCAKLQVSYKQIGSLSTRRTLYWCASCTTAERPTACRGCSCWTRRVRTCWSPG